MDSTRTILELKSIFIRRQLRILSESLEPNENWNEYARSEEEDLSEKVVEDALQKSNNMLAPVNTALKQHNRIVYSTQAIHHVAQQIASLYWSLVTRDSSGLKGHVSGIEKTAVLSRHATISELPISLEIATTEGDRKRYQQLRERLVSLDTRRQQRRRRLIQLQELQRLLVPFQDPRRDIQPNLITRDGELFKELEKMRMLTARVGGRIGQKKMHNTTTSNKDHEVEASPGFDQKLETVLNMTS